MTFHGNTHEIQCVQSMNRISSMKIDEYRRRILGQVEMQRTGIVWPESERKPFDKFQTEEIHV